MATTGMATDTGRPADLASDLRNATQVRVVSRADGDGLAAGAILGRALADVGIPRHISLTLSSDEATAELESATTGVALGFPDLEQFTQPQSAALWAFELARELGSKPDTGLALGGARAADITPKGTALEAAKDQGLDDRPGLAIPTTDVARGLAYSGLVHGDFSGDRARAETFLADIDGTADGSDETKKPIASAVALDVTDGPTANRAIQALEKALHPITSPTAFETIGGYADVLEAAVKLDPGSALAALLGDVAESHLLELWTEYGKSLHDAVAELPTDVGTVMSATVDEIPPNDVARLGHAFRVDATRLYVGGRGSIALSTTEKSAIKTLSSHFRDEQVDGTDALATVQTDASVDTVRDEIEANR